MEPLGQALLLVDEQVSAVGVHGLVSGTSCSARQAGCRCSLTREVSIRGVDTSARSGGSNARLACPSACRVVPAARRGDVAVEDLPLPEAQQAEPVSVRVPVSAGAGLLDACGGLWYGVGCYCVRERWEPTAANVVSLQAFEEFTANWEAAVAETKATGKEPRLLKVILPHHNLGQSGSVQGATGSLVPNLSSGQQRSSLRTASGLTNMLPTCAYAA